MPILTQQDLDRDKDALLEARGLSGFISKNQIKYLGNAKFQDVAKETYGEKTRQIANNKRRKYRKAISSLTPLQQIDAPDIRKDRPASIYTAGDQKLTARGFTAPRSDRPIVMLLTDQKDTKSHEMTHTLPIRRPKSKDLVKFLGREQTSEQKKQFDRELKFRRHVEVKPSRSSYGFIGRQLTSVPEASARAVPVIRNYFRETGKTINSVGDWKKAVRRYDSPDAETLREQREARRAFRRSPLARTFGQALY